MYRNVSYQVDMIIHDPSVRNYSSPTDGDYSTYTLGVPLVTLLLCLPPPEDGDPIL